MEILTRSKLRLTLEGRSVTVRGEAFLPGGPGPDFEVYADSIRTWGNGESITEPEKQKIIQTILAEAKRKGWKIEIV